MYRWRQLLIKKPIILGGAFVYLMLAYFVYHSLHGERGIFSYVRMSQELELKREKLNELKAERLVLEQRVGLMRVDSIDLDMLDELARKNLGLIGKDEFVIIIERSE